MGNPAQFASKREANSHILPTLPLSLGGIMLIVHTIQLFSFFPTGWASEWVRWVSEVSEWGEWVRWVSEWVSAWMIKWLSEWVSLGAYNKKKRKEEKKVRYHNRSSYTRLTNLNPSIPVLYLFVHLLSLLHKNSLSLPPYYSDALPTCNLRNDTIR